MKIKTLIVKRFVPLIFISLFFYSQPLAVGGGKSYPARQYRVPLYAAGIPGHSTGRLNENDIRVVSDKGPISFSLVNYTETIHDEISPRKMGRAFFIIIDSSLTGLPGFNRAKEIAEKLVNNGLPGDTFTILQMSPIKGFSPVISRGIEKTALIEGLNKLELYPGLNEKTRKKHLKPSRSRRSIRYRRPSGLLPNVTKLLSVLKRKFQEEPYYADQTLIFSYFLSKFKRTLRTIEKPKIVFVISGGQGDKAGRELNDTAKRYQTFFKHSLDAIIKEAGDSGSLLFQVNPDGMDPTAAQIMDESFTYYELLVRMAPPAEDASSGGKKRVEIKSPTKGIHLHYPRYIAGGTPYRWLDTFQKRVLLLDVILEDPWVRLAGPVRKTPFEVIAAGETGDETGETLHRHVRIPLPGDMRYRELEVFTVYINPNTGKADIDFSSSLVKEQLLVPFKHVKDSRLFFVVIEPSGFSCIYNQVK